jgi:hypothetical protein
MEVEKPKIEVANPSHFTWLKMTLFVVMMCGLGKLFLFF